MNKRLSPEEINACYDGAHERWERDGKTELYEFAFLWQYIAYEVAKAQDTKTLKEAGIGLEKVIRGSILTDDGWVYTIPKSFVEDLKKGGCQNERL